jgi:hypothetical protein
MPYVERAVVLGTEDAGTAVSVEVQCSMLSVIHALAGPLQAVRFLLRQRLFCKCGK